MKNRWLFGVVVLASQAAWVSAQISQQTFWQEQRTSHTVENGLPEGKILAIGRHRGGRVVVSTDQKVLGQRGKRWIDVSKRVQPKWLISGDANFWIADEMRVGVIADRFSKWLPITKVSESLRISALAVSPHGRVLLGTNDGVWELTHVGKQRAIGALQGPLNRQGVRQISMALGTVLALAVSGADDVAIGTAEGLYLQRPGRQLEPVYPEDRRYRWAPRDVKAVAYDSLGRLWFGCPLGVGRRDADGQWELFTGREGLPWNEFTCAAAGENGVIWFGTTRGALRYDGKRWAYRAGLRWLPDDHVNSIAVDETGSAWIATNGGVSHIERVEMTLARKAEFFEDQVERRHNREGYQAQCRLERRGDVSSWKPAVSDNDGQYTSLYGAAEVFRWAVTKDPEARRRARRSFEACKRLVDITPMPGFPARVIVPIEWLEDENLIEIYGHEYNQRNKEDDPLWKLIYPRWIKTEDGKHLWKCDTSTDEVVAHIFFYSLYYDLVADNERERAEVREVTTAIVDHIIDNGLVLRDWDGKPTRWANWSPEHLNSKDGHYERGLNSLMILAMLSAAEHMTHDSRYADVAKQLREQHAYHINALYAKAIFPPANDVPWDYLLSFLSYYPLLTYEKDPGLRAIYLESLDRTWLSASRHKHPFYNFLYLALAQDDDPQKQDVRASMDSKIEQILNESIQTLRGIPLELMGWQTKNSHRLDVVRDPTPGRTRPYGWSVVDGGALPIEERYHVRLDRSSLLLDGVEGDGWDEHEGTIFLLPYYMGLHHGFIK